MSAVKQRVSVDEDLALVATDLAVTSAPKKAATNAPKPPERLTQMVWGIIDAFERTAGQQKQRRRELFTAAGVQERTYYRWRAWADPEQKKKGSPPALVGLYKLCEAVGLRLHVGGSHTSVGQHAKEVADMDPDLAEIDAAMVGMDPTDRERVVQMVQRYAANRVPPRPQDPARVSGAARGRVRS